jgi:hypothetical protein
LLLILAVAVPAHAETRLSVGVDRDRTRDEVPSPRTTAALLRIDLSRFVAPLSRMFEPIARPEPPKLELLELRDSASRDAWAADRDFELAAMWNALSIAINHHVVDRNWGEAQVTATFTREL